MKTKIILFGILLGLLILLAPGSALSGSPYGYAPPWAGPSGGLVEPRALRLERQADRDNYYLTLHLTGMTPQEVTVALEGGGRWLSIGSDASSESSHQQTSDQGGYTYSRSFSYSSSRSNRRISLPWDANGSAMQRTDANERVEITIPRQR